MARDAGSSVDSGSRVDNRSKAAELPQVNMHADPSQWAARLRLRFARTSRGVRLVEKEHIGPLYIQKPFYPEGLDVPHAYLLHPPGGLVSGDHLDIQIVVDYDAQALVTTPGAGRMYRAREDESPQTQSVTFKIAEGGVVEWLPLEAIFFPGANAVADNRVYLEAGAKVIYWDVACLGLPANKQRFERGSINQSLRIYQQGRLVLQERLVLNNGNRSILDDCIGFQSKPIQGLMVAGPFEHEQVELLEQLRALVAEQADIVGVTQVSGFIVIRQLGECSEKVRTVLTQMWQLLRPALLGRTACSPRIWNT